MSRLAAWVVAAAAGIAAIVVPLRQLSNSATEVQPVAPLVEAVTGDRPFIARVSGGFAYAPYRAEASPGAPDRQRVQLVSAVGRVRAVYEAETRVPARQALGVASLVVGDFDDAVANFALAAAADPANPRVANDLAAAYYERAVRAERPDDLPRALEAIERAIALAPGNAEILFNRALVLSALAMKSQAVGAWEAYLAVDAQTPWAAEARARLGQLQTPRPTAEEFAALQRRLEAGSDAAAAETVVRAHASAARQWFEGELLRRWAVATPRSREEQQALQIMRGIADAFLRLTNDHFYADVAAAIERASLRATPGELTQFKNAHREMLEAYTLMSGAQHAAGAARLKAVRPGFGRWGSPYSARIDIEVAGSEYFAMRYDAVAAALPAIKDAALRRHHLVLLGRAARLEGLTAWGRNDFSLAQAAYEQFEDASAESGDIDNVVAAGVLLANLHWQVGDLAMAWRYVVEAATAVQSAGSPLPLYVLYMSAAANAASGGHHHAALTFQTAALPLAPRVGPVFEAQGLAQRARTLYELHRESEAVQDLTTAWERIASVPDAATRSRVEPDLLLTEAQIFRQSNPERAAAAAERALAAPAVHRDAVRVAQLNLLLADALAGTATPGRAAEALRQGISALEQAREVPGRAIAQSDRAWGLYERALGAALRRDDPRRAFEYSERRRIRTSFEHRAWNGRVLSLEALQRGLTPETALAVFTQLGDQLQVWIVTSGGVQTHAATVSTARASSLVSSHLNEMMRGADVPVVSAQLFDLILRPVAPALAGVRTLVIVADAPYNQIAFAGLWDRTRSRYLVDDLAVVAAPSATAFAWAMANTSTFDDTRRRGAVILETPGTADRGEHRDRIAGLYRSSELRRGDTVTPARLIADARARDVVHIAAPVRVNREFPSFSRLLLADTPNRKYSGAVFAMRLADTELSHARLIALEATPGGRATSDGDGALGLVSALLVAGVPNVVGPVAGVRASSLENTWLEFHRHYADGLSASESLRRAQLSVLRDSRRRPGAWAMLTVFGSTQ